MLTPALPLDMALFSTSMAYDLALPIVPIPIVPIRIVALPIVALPIVTLPIVALLTLRVSSWTFVRYKQCGIWSTTSGPAEASFEGKEAGDNTCHCVRLVSDLECGCKCSLLFGIREVGHEAEFPPTVFNRDVAYGKVIDYLDLG